LLDWSEQSVVHKATLELQLSEDDLIPALRSLVEKIWQNRPKGVRYGEALNILKPEIDEKAGELIVVWRKSRFLTVEGNIRFAEPLVADRIFAKFLNANLKNRTLNF